MAITNVAQLFQQEVSEKRRKRKFISDLSHFPPIKSIRSHLEAAANLKGEQADLKLLMKNQVMMKKMLKAMHHDLMGILQFCLKFYFPTSFGKYKLPMSRIIPFPKKNDPSTAPDYPAGKHVLAVYPGTTALYKATVVNSRKRRNDDYILKFDDDEEDGSLPQRNVMFYKVVPLPDGHRQ